MQGIIARVTILLLALFAVAIFTFSAIALTVGNDRPAGGPPAGRVETSTLAR